jgi:hypothetical protein
VGDKANAIKNWEIAIANLPKGREFMLASMEAGLKKAREGK